MGAPRIPLSIRTFLILTPLVSFTCLAARAKTASQHKGGRRAGPVFLSCDFLVWRSAHPTGSLVGLQRYRRPTDDAGHLEEYQLGPLILPYAWGGPPYPRPGEQTSDQMGICPSSRQGLPLRPPQGPPKRQPHPDCQRVPESTHTQRERERRKSGGSLDRGRSAVTPGQRRWLVARGR